MYMSSLSYQLSDQYSGWMTDELTTHLAKIKSLRVISRTSAMQYKNVRKPLADIARSLHVDSVVEGSVVRSGDKLRITVQLVDARTDRHIWAEDYNRDLRDVVAVQGDVARRIAEEIRIFILPIPYQIVEHSEIVSVLSGPGNWGNYDYKYPRSAGFLELSRVGFNRDGSQAAFYTSLHCGSQCGAGYFVIMERDAKADWKIVQEVQLWVS